MTLSGTIHGERDKRTKVTQQVAGNSIVSLSRRPVSGENASNIQSRQNGIALAKAKPSRPSGMMVAERSESSAKDMQKIHPAIVRAAGAERRFSAAWRFCSKTNIASPTRGAERTKTPAVFRLLVSAVN